MNGSDRERITVFVSYAHADEDRVATVIEELSRRNISSVLWHDKLIAEQDYWYREIYDQLLHAKVAILLLSPNFLASQFCRFEEVPILSQRKRRGELEILPFVLEACEWQAVPWLSRLYRPPMITDVSSGASHTPRCAGASCAGSYQRGDTTAGTRLPHVPGQSLRPTEVA
jgi:hypothetical protein